MLKQMMLVATILALATFVALGQTAITVDTINQMGGNGTRYTAVQPFQIADWSVFGDQAQYENEEQFNGFALSTAGQLGLTRGLNEMPGNRSVVVVLNPNEPIRYNGNQYWLDNCKVNGRPYKNRFKPITPPPAPSAAPTPTPQPATVAAIPLCKLGGNLEQGFVGVALNGEGKFTINGQAVAHEKVDAADVLKLNEASGGTSTVVYTVTGQGGSVACENKFDVFSQVATIATLTPSVTIPRIRFCDTDRDGWRPDRLFMGMVEKVRCDPGHMILDTGLGAVGGWALTRAFPGPLRPHPPVQVVPKPGITVTPPR